MDIRKMEKKLIYTFCIFLVLNLCFISFVAFELYCERTIAVDASKFAMSSDDIIRDLHYRSVVINSQGQLWGFLPDQNLTVDVLQIKSIDDGVSVYVKLRADATVKESSKSVAVELHGIAKLHYEYVAGTWQLSEISSVNLRPRQK